MSIRGFVSAAALLALAGGASAGLTDEITDTTAGASVVADGVLGANEYGAGNGFVFTGAGTGFGGTLGNGALYMESDATDLYFGFAPGGDLNDNVVIFLDTRAGGVSDDTFLSDIGDPGRNLSSNLTRDVGDNWAIGADFSIVIGGFGIVVFELADDGNGQLVFTQYDGTFTGNSSTLLREGSLSLATLGLSATGHVDFFAAYGSDTNFMSDEGLPGQGFGNGNLGFDNGGNGDVTWANYSRFNLPAPGSVALLGLGGLLGARRRR